jgi:hypothetical protein
MTVMLAAISLLCGIPLGIVIGIVLGFQLGRPQPRTPDDDYPTGV